MAKKYLLVIITVVSGIFMLAKCNHADNTGSQLKLLKMIEFRRSLDKPINYYGKVIDLQGRPIKNVNVEVHISRASGKKIIKYSTDADGRFIISGIDGSDLAVENLLAQGYAYLAENRNNGHDLYENDGSKVITENNPVIFTMRKKEQPTVVVEGHISAVFAKDVKYYDVDLVEMIDEGPYNLKRYHGPYAHVDIRTRIEYSADTDSYTFILETPDSNSGIIELNQALYVPPDRGYKTPYKIVVPKGQQKETFLYVKSRGGQVYSKLDIKFVPAVKDDKIYWAAEAHTNPIGERNLDFDEAKYIEYNKQKLANRKKMVERIGVASTH